MAGPLVCFMLHHVYADIPSFQFTNVGNRRLAVLDDLAEEKREGTKIDLALSLRHLAIQYPFTTHRLYVS
jgi:hypothetical protein